MGKSLVAHVGKQSVGLICVGLQPPDNKPLSHQPRPPFDSLTQKVENIQEDLADPLFSWLVWPGDRVMLKEINL